MPKISVVIPVYNSEKHISKCLESVINQSFSDIEIICINDKTPDNSFEIVKEYAKKDSRIVLKENEENKRAGLTRNVGIDIARGEYISFIDSDDYIDSLFLEELYSTAKKYDSDIVTTVNFSYIRGENIDYNEDNYVPNINKWKKEYPDNYEEGESDLNIKNIIHNSIHFTFLVVWNKLWKKTFIDMHKLRFGDMHNTQDADFFYRSILHNPRASYNHRAKHYYIASNPTSLTETGLSNHISVISTIAASKNIINYYNLHLSNDKKCLDYATGYSLELVFSRFFAHKEKTTIYNYVHDYFNEMNLQENDFLESFKYLYKKYNLIKTFTTYDQYLFADNLINQLADTNNRLEDTNNRLADTNNRLEDTNNRLADTNNRLYDEIRTADNKLEETKYNVSWIKLFGIYNNRERLKIVIFGISIVLKINEKNINKIAWWIPVRKWRDSFRMKFI